MTAIRLAADLRSVDLGATEPQAAFAVARRIEIRRNQKNEPYADLELCDCTASFRAKVWATAGEALEAARKLRAGDAVKVLFELDTFQGNVQFNVKRLRPIQDADRDAGYDPARLYGEAHELVRELRCATLAIDIETVPTADLRKVPPTIAQAVSRAAESREYDEAKVMGLSPFFGQVVSLAAGDADQDPATMPITVFLVPPPGMALPELPDFVRCVSEVELLSAFWGLAALADTVVTFNGQGFDIPYLVARSVLLGVPARVDLLARGNRQHCDVLAALTQGSRNLHPASLEIVCWALGIESPKGEMDGAMVAPAWRQGELAKIATYNAADVRATAAIYQRLKDTLLCFRS
ncbi:MAG TPA: ribonuclease H-like domain-containing protein [Planctomycetota bacterium]|nr:ribonuclease H-like domain-containing protein [Planctomycetota bacterium]